MTEHVDTAVVECEENGWHLVVETDEDSYRFLLPHDVALDLDRSLRMVREHEAEGQAVRREMLAGGTLRPYEDVAEVAAESLREWADHARKAERENAG